MAMYVDAAGELSPMLFEVGFGPAQRKEREERRFHDLLVEEKSRFHSVSLSEEQPANYTPPFYYQPLPLPNEYDPTMFISNPTRGLARLIPQDGRIELAFDLHWQAKKDEHKWKMSPLRDYGFDDDGCLKYLQEQAEPRIKSLNSFGEEIQTFGNFFIWDADPSKPTNGHVLYNLGCSEPYFDIPEESNRGNQIREMTKFFGDDRLCQWLDEQKWFGQPTQHDNTAPWKRIILCQGLSLVSQARIKEQSFPFLVFNDRDDPINMATNIHLSCEQRGGSESANPYSNPHTAFHITFYERLTKENLEGLTAQNLSSLIEESHKRKLKIGRLYSKPRKDNDEGGSGDDDENGDELAFRQSSFTVITTARHVQTDYWTMLILSPSGFFNSPAEIKSDKDWKITLGQKSQKGAELLIIIYALRKVEERWRQFNEYIGSLLVEDFMNPTAYLNLLFEDKNFSYSKLYFWAIGCLNEFTVSIEDNIKQLQLFRKERIPHPSSKSPALPQELLSLDEEAGKIAQSLEDIRAQFKAKSVTIQALRDGLFNATAVREASRSTDLAEASTLLAKESSLLAKESSLLAKESSLQNRYILVFTIATVFYLPISFVSSFYGMHLFDPNGNPTESQTPFIVTAILLSLATYAVAFLGLRFVEHDYDHRGDANTVVDPGERTQGHAKQSNEAEGEGASKGNGCLNFLRRRKKSSDAV